LMAHAVRWFFEPVGMGVPPAKLHEKLASWQRWKR
jgi:hypothetical protein